MRVSSPYATTTWTGPRTSAATNSTAPSWRSWSNASRFPTRGSSASERDLHGRARAPLPGCGGQMIEHGHRLVPAYACVGDALTVTKVLPLVRDRLIAFNQMAFQHHAADCERAARDLLG